MKKHLRIWIVLVSVILLVTALYVLFVPDALVMPGGEVSTPVEQAIPQNPIGWIQKVTNWGNVSVRISLGN